MGEPGTTAELLVVAIYDTLADSWTYPDTSSAPWPGIGDGPCCVLPDGTVLLGSFDPNRTDTAIFDPGTELFTLAAPTRPKADASSEETWTLLPNNTVLTVQCRNPGNAQKYDVASNKWLAAGAVTNDIGVELSQPCPGIVNEIGPAISR